MILVRGGDISVHVLFFLELEMVLFDMNLRFGVLSLQIRIWLNKFDRLTNLNNQVAYLLNPEAWDGHRFDITEGSRVGPKKHLLQLRLPVELKKLVGKPATDPRDLQELLPVSARNQVKYPVPLAELRRHGPCGYQARQKKIIHWGQRISTRFPTEGYERI